MATLTKTYTENAESSYKSTWTLTITGTNVTASGASVSIPVPTITAKYVNSNKNNGQAWVYGAWLYANGTRLGSSSNYLGWDLFPSSWASGATKTLTKDTNSVSVATSTLFNSNNSTAKTVDVSLRGGGNIATSEIDFKSWYGSGDDRWNNYNGTFSNLGNVSTVTLNAPPTFDATNVTFDTSYVYTGLTTASVTVSSLSAKYGGTISEVKLTIGNQSATRTNNGTLSIPLGAEGTFTPTVTVTDSRGQVTTKTLDAITVNGYTAPAVSFSVQRSLANGVPADEGTYGAISADFTFTDVIADLAQPTVAIDGTTASVTWYASRASDGTMSGTVDWSTLSSPATVYGIVDAPNIQVSYQITVTPNDSISSGTPITQPLASAFYTIDFLAGGHGIAFGQPATEEGFFCNMDAHFKDKANLVRALFDFIHPVGSYYETSDTTFDPNVTWGGTWVLETAGQVHVSAGTGYTVSGALTNTSDGGETGHVLTIDEMPAHTHRQNYVNYNRGAGSSATMGYLTQTSQSYFSITESTGGGLAHNNMQPYIIVNRWHRTA